MLSSRTEDRSEFNYYDGMLVTRGGRANTHPIGNPEAMLSLRV
mgnify:CR=1 FL=1